MGGGFFHEMALVIIVILSVLFVIGLIQLNSKKLEQQLSRDQSRLRGSEERYRRLVEQSLQGLVIAQDNPLRLCFVSKPMEAITGYSKEELIELGPQQLIALIHPEDRETFFQNFRDRLSGKEIPPTNQYRLLHKTKGTRWVEVYSSRTDYENTTATQTVFLDVTDRKRADEALKESEERFRLLVKHSNDIFVIIDETGRETFLSESVERFTGFTVDEILGSNGFNYIHPDDAAHMVETLSWLQSNPGKSRRAEYRHIHKNGSWVRMEAIGTNLLNDPRINGIVLNVRDVTDRKQAEEALRESERRFRELFENIKDIIYTHDIEGRFTSVNPALCKAFGYKQDELIGRRASDFMKPELASAFESEYLEQLKNKGFQEGITAYFNKRGEKIHIEYKSSLIKPNNGEPYITGVGRDVTERIQSARKLKKIQQQLQQSRKMEAVGTLAGGIAHDFNNLLQAINGYTQLLILEQNEKNKDYEKLEQIQKAGERAAQLVRQLLLFSRKVETEHQPIDLNNEIDQARQILERTIPKMVEIKIRPESRLWSINADPVQIEQILLNLGKNASDAMPDGGNLVIETENVVLNEEFADNNLGARPGRYVLLTVSDTGLGMDKETVEHIFEPFFSTKEIGKGTGLGLASVYGIVKSHGGYINCYSEVGQGTTFKIYFPAVEQTKAVEGGNRTCGPPEGGTETILLVDDEGSIRDFASQALEKYGYSVLVTSSGEEALERFAVMSKEIDLTILDIGMPGMGGRKCFQEITRIDPSAQVLIASGYSITGQVKDTLDAGAAGYVGKPYQLHDLLKKIREILEK